MPTSGNEMGQRVGHTASVHVWKITIRVFKVRPRNMSLGDSRRFTCQGGIIFERYPLHVTVFFENSLRYYVVLKPSLEAGHKMKFIDLRASVDRLNQTYHHLQSSTGFNVVGQLAGWLALGPSCGTACSLQITRSVRVSWKIIAPRKQNDVMVIFRSGANGASLAKSLLKALTHPHSALGKSEEKSDFISPASKVASAALRAPWQASLPPAPREATVAGSVDAVEEDGTEERKVGYLRGTHGQK
ncbi:hypothetical protein MJO28_002668 [Puccinia striiformis f. sp. tritici]|uniref:Uncharacterized protein n=1 Tax=Puccinia striiformis f. sp. tritici TaxID=168172 RepID=A0ACC0EQZ6_9BASI|nr:hypothetical protein MJO28_002668 [Puccinia striiformis f. sp. tritici]